MQQTIAKSKLQSGARHHGLQTQVLTNVCKTECRFRNEAIVSSYHSKRFVGSWGRTFSTQISSHQLTIRNSRTQLLVELLVEFAELPYCPTRVSTLNKRSHEHTLKALFKSRFEKCSWCYTFLGERHARVDAQPVTNTFSWMQKLRPTSAVNGWLALGAWSI